MRQDTSDGMDFTESSQGTTLEAERSPVVHRIAKQRGALTVLSLAVAFSTGLRAHDEPVEVYSAASRDKEAAVAPNSVAIVEGEFGDHTTMAPNGQPQLEVDSVTVVVEGSDGVEVGASLFSVAPRELRILLPDVPVGNVHLTAKRGDEVLAEGEFQVQAVSPGLFSAAGTGGGLADGQALTVNLSTAELIVSDLAYHNSQDGSYRSIPLAPAATGVVLYLKLRGTGIRAASEISVTVDGTAVPVVGGVVQGTPPGVDEVNIGPLPVHLMNSELADVVLTADGFTTNTVQVAFTATTGPAITFSNQIFRLFQANCQECHRPGEVAPFSLVDYADASAWATAIKQVVTERVMPPWKPVAGHGEFVGERRLTEDEIEMIVSWVDAGFPEGDQNDLPEALEFNADWTLGEPDLILQTPSYTPDPDVVDDYRCFSAAIPDSIDESKSITAIEIRPGNRDIVHHLILFGDPVGESVGLEAADQTEAPGYECFGSAGISFSGFTLGVESYIMGGWAPGSRPQVLPEGSGIYLRRGSRIAIQIHYHPDGTSQSDSTRIGLHFAPERTPRNTTVLQAINRDFTIPAGEERYEVTAEFKLNDVIDQYIPPAVASLLEATGVFPIDIVGVVPHMHTLGREIRMDKIPESGESTPMVYIQDWDFDWQDWYTYVNPVPLDLSDRLVVSAIYDNSATNPRNPNSPPIAVRWGDGTADEMCIVFFAVDIPDLCALPLGLCSSH